MSALAEATKPIHNAETKAVTATIFNILLRNGDLVCQVDDSVDPPQILPISTKNGHSISQLTLHNTLKPLLPDTTLRALDLHTYQRAATTDQAQQVYDVPVDAASEAELRKQAAQPDSKIKVLPQRALTRFLNTWHWQTLEQVLTDRYLADTETRQLADKTTTTELQNFAAEELVQLQQQLQQQRKTLVFDRKTNSFIFDAHQESIAGDPERYQQYQLAESVSTLEQQQIADIPAMLRASKSSEHWFGKGEALVRELEQLEQSMPVLNGESFKHRLPLKTLDLLEQVIPNQELVTRMRKLLVTSRLMGYFWYRLGGGAVEATITAGGLAGGAGDIIAIMAILTNTVGVEFPKELQAGDLHEQLRICLQDIIREIEENYAEEIQSGIIEQLPIKMADEIATGEEIYSDFADIVVPATQQTIALLANDKPAWTAAYITSIIAIKAVERYINKPPGLGRGTRKLLQVLVKGSTNLAVSVIDEVSDRLGNSNPFMEYSTAIVPLLTNTIDRVSTHLVSHEDIEASKNSVQQLERVLFTLRQHSINLQTATQKELHAVEVQTALQDRVVDFDKLPTIPSIYANSQQQIASDGVTEHEEVPVHFFDRVEYADSTELEALWSKNLTNLYQNHNLSSKQREAMIVILFSPFIDEVQPVFKAEHQQMEQLLRQILKQQNVSEVIQQLVRAYTASDNSTATIDAVYQQLTAVSAKSTNLADLPQKFWECIKRTAQRWKLIKVRATLMGESTQNSPRLRSKKNYKVLKTLEARGVVPPTDAPYLVGFELNQSVGAEVLLKDLNFISQPGKVLFLEDFPELAVDALTGNAAASGTTFIHTSETDYNVQLDQTESIFHRLKLSQTTSRDILKNYEHKFVSKQEFSDYLHTLSFFTPDELTIITTHLDQDTTARIINYKLSAKLQLVEALLSDAEVIVLENFFAVEYTTQELASIQESLVNLASKRVVVCTTSSSSPDLDRVLSTFIAKDSATVLQLDTQTHTAEYAPVGIHDLIREVKKFGIPYSEAAFQDLQNNEYHSNVYLTSAELCATHNQRLSALPEQQTEAYAPQQFKPAFKSIDKLLAEITLGETRVYDWTLEQLYEQLAEMSCSIKLLLPELTPANKDKKVFLRITDSVQDDIRYRRKKADGTTEELVLVENKQILVNEETGDAALDEAGKRRNRERFNRLGVLEKYNASTEDPVTASLRGVSAELGITISSEQCSKTGEEAELKYSDTYSCASIVKFTHHRVLLTDEQFTELTADGPVILNPQRDKTSTFGFIPVDKVAQYHAGTITANDFVN